MATKELLFMDGMPPWIDIALKEVGQKEIKGDEDNPRIIEYHSATKLKATEDEVPWCSSFANWCMKIAGLIGTSSAAARSWMSWGYPCSEPVKYCVVILRRGSKSWQGHVGFLMDWDDREIRVLGGNQKDSVSFQTFKRTDVLGYRWPKKEYILVQKNN